MEASRAPDLFFAGALIYKEERGELVPTWRYRVEPFQHACAASGLQWTEIERLCGWQGGRGSYVQRLLGLKPRAVSGQRVPLTSKKYVPGDKYPPGRATSLSYENAVKIARALDLDFVEYEL